MFRSIFSRCAVGALALFSLGGLLGMTPPPPAPTLPTPCTDKTCGTPVATPCTDSTCGRTPTPASTPCPVICSK